MSSKVEKWGVWLDVIGSQIKNMLIKQDTHNTILQIIKSNEALQQHNLFYDHLFHTYMAYISVALRRQIKNQSNSISLYGLLFDMSNNKRDIPEHKFISVDPDGDMKIIKEASIVIEDYVDKRIAHTDNRPLKQLPSPNQIDDCIFMFKKIHRRYNSVINNIDVDLMPAIYDWTGIFKIPWVQEK